jgi:hypothetical protein
MPLQSTLGRLIFVDPMKISPPSAFAKADNVFVSLAGAISIACKSAK